MTPPSNVSDVPPSLPDTHLFLASSLTTPGAPLSPPCSSSGPDDPMINSFEISKPQQEDTQVLDSHEKKQQNEMFYEVEYQSSLFVVV